MAHEKGKTDGSSRGRILPETIAAMHSSADPNRFSPLSETQREQLIAAGNTSGEWESVRVSSDFDGSRITGCELDSCRIAGRPILRASRIADSTLLERVSVRSCSLVRGYIIAAGATIEDSRLDHTGESAFGNKVDVLLGSERPMERIPIFAELDCDELCRTNAKRTAIILPETLTSEEVSGYRDAVTSSRGLIGEEASVIGVRMLRSSFIDSGVDLCGCNEITNSTFLKGSSAGAGIIVRNSMIQSGASVEDGAELNEVLLGPKARVSECASVTSSVLGRRSEFVRGEVRCCLIGPLVNMHHEALLIATNWPAGRGNVGSGAQVGSNHTSRLPDQSLLAGEGIFFGLATAIKFPANYSESPYTVIATGLITGPQRICFPFSLLSLLDDIPADAPSGYNRLVPGWMFSHNLFAILRDEYKHAQRLGLDPSETRAIRPEIAELVAGALSRLEAIDTPSEWYDDGRIDGVGKNVLLEVDRKRGITAYRDLLDYHKLRRSIDSGETIDAATCDRFVELLQKLKVRTRDSRARDFHRGGRIFDDYDTGHPDPDLDSELSAVIGILDSEEREVLSLAGK